MKKIFWQTVLIIPIICIFVFFSSCSQYNNTDYTSLENSAGSDVENADSKYIQSGSGTGYESKKSEITEQKKDKSYEELVWVSTKGGKKYHKKRTCSNMKDPEHVTLKNAEENGFTPCSKCY